LPLPDVAYCQACYEAGGGDYNGLVNITINDTCVTCGNADLHFPYRVKAHRDLDIQDVEHDTYGARGKDYYEMEDN
jgi:hypothetical protein